MKLLHRAILALPLMLAYAGFCQFNTLNVTHEWKYIDYLWENDNQKTDAINAGLYDYTKIIPFDIELLLDGRMLITTPRSVASNPASLSVISSRSGANGPLLVPYPNWSWHKMDNCTGMTSVSKITVDDCGRLWVVDSGKIGNEQVCPPQILAFNVTNDELLVQVEIPRSLSHNSKNASQGRLEIQAVETIGESCAITWVYISDIEGYGLLIWDGLDIWRLENKLYEPVPGAETISIAGDNFTYPRGLEGLLLTPPGFLKETYLIFKPLSSYKTLAVTTEDLHNSKTGSNVSYYLTNWTAPSQEPGKSFAKNGGVLIAGFIEQSALGCWNLQNPLEADSVATLVQNSTILQYIAITKITQCPKDGIELVLVLTTRLQKFMLGTMDFTETNFRIMQGDVNELVKSTVCAPRNHTIADSMVEKYFLPIES